MSEHYIAVCDINENYAVSLAGTVMRYMPEHYSSAAFTGTESLIDFGSAHDICAVIISESAYEPRVAGAFGGKLIILRENPDFVSEEAVLIDRFQSCEDLMRSVIKNLPECMEGISAGRLESHHWKVIGIYSPIRRCLQTSFALAMGQMLAGEAKVLYMNFENFSGFSGWFDAEFGNDITDFLYYYDCGKEKLAARIPTLIHKLGNLDIMPPAASYYDTYERSGEKWVEVMKTIEASTDYEYLILDLTDAMQGLLQVMEYCDRIYTLVPPDRISLAKLDQYENWMVDHYKADIIGKTMKFTLPQFTDLPSRPDMLTRCELAGYVSAVIREDTVRRSANG